MNAGRYDAIVIGAGHNGLIAAAYFARAGKKVLVLERRDIVGGAAVTEEIFPGYRFTEFSYVVSLLRPEIIRDLELPKHGLKILPLPSTVTPLENGDYLAAWDDHDLTRRELYRHSPRDAEATDEYSRVMARAAKAIKPIIGLVPPDPSSLSWRDVQGLLKLGRYGASLSEKERYRIAKLVTQSAGDLLDEWFEFDPLKGTKSASGIIGTFLGPRSPGTAYVLLHHYMGEIDGAFRAWGFAKNGTGGVTAAIASSARALGVEIRTGAAVDKVVVKGGRAAGVALANGDEYEASVVLSAADPKRTFLQFVESKHLPDEFVTAIRQFRVRGSSGKVNIALSELPQFTCLPGEGPLHRGAISSSPSIDYIERAYDEAKYGQFSRRPYIDAIIPSMIDRDMPWSCPIPRSASSIWPTTTSSAAAGCSTCCSARAWPPGSPPTRRSRPQSTPRRRRPAPSCAASSSVPRRRRAATSPSTGCTSSSTIRRSAPCCARTRSGRSMNESSA